MPLALTFLTVFPWRWKGPAAPEDLARSMFWFPWVGALLGVVYLGAWIGFQRLLPPPAAAGLLLCLTVIMTGGLHLDGLADTADGLAGGRNPAERLQIMKDSRLGTFGVASLALALILKFAFLLALPAMGLEYGSIFLFPVISRWGLVFLAYLSPNARPEGGLGQAMIEGVNDRVLAGASVAALALSLLACGFRGMVLFTAAGLFVWLLSRFFLKKLGGITGDVLGAANELLEILVLGGSLL